MTCVVILGFIILLLIACLVGGYCANQHDWNGGVCRYSDAPWKSFDIASDGSVGYTDGSNNYIWINWSRVTRDKRNVR